MGNDVEIWKHIVRLWRVAALLFFLMLTTNLALILVVLDG